MKSEEQTYWQIHDFLKGSLSEEEKTSFQEELEQNPSLKEELEKHKAANKLILQNRIRQAAYASHETQKSLRKSNGYRKIALVSLFTLAISAATYVWLDREKKTETPLVSAPVRVSEQRDNHQIPLSATLPNVPMPETEKRVQKSRLPQKRETIAAYNQADAQGHQTEAGLSVSSVNPLPEAKVEEKIGEKPVPMLPKVTEVSSSKHHCEGANITAQISVSNACAGQENGSIVASKIQGGHGPYSYEIRSEKGNKVFSKDELPSGNYRVTITDHQHCSQVLDNILVKEVTCEEPEKVFNPFLGEMFEFPAASHGGHLKVYEKNGHIFYEKAFSANEKIEWNGISQHGEMETGHLVYEILYQDGTRKFGTVTITR